MDNRHTWVLSNLSYTTMLKSSYVFSSYGVINDIVMGDWWATTDVSPYRKEMAKRFTDWIKYQHNIISYQYPQIGISKGNKKMILTQKIGPTKTPHSIRIIPFEYEKQKYAYLGGELWGIFSKTGNKISIIGEPETSDNYLKYAKNRFLFLED